jgi:hypothetical protein
MIVDMCTNKECKQEYCIFRNSAYKHNRMLFHFGVNKVDRKEIGTCPYREREENNAR